MVSVGVGVGLRCGTVGVDGGWCVNLCVSICTHWGWVVGEWYQVRTECPEQVGKKVPLEQ